MVNLSELFIVGVDEVGRGPLAGPVVAAAVCFNGEIPEGLADSKKLSAKQRAALVPIIKSCSSWAIAEVSSLEIDRINILQASLLAMRNALGQLPLHERHVIQVDGNMLPDLSGILFSRAEAIVKGDSKVAAISAASILAKEYRDALMARMDTKHPGYGFAKHAGYGVPQHLDALIRLGPCAEHRRSFAPVRNAEKG